MRINKLGRLLAAVAIASATLSCQKDAPVQDGRYPILFDCADYNTRAIADITDLQVNGFEVYAYFTKGENAFNFAKDVRYETSTSTWTYDELEYWWPETSYSFKAFYPSDTFAVTEDGQSYSLISDYSVLTQTDLLMASETRNVGSEGIIAPDEGSVVNLRFQHLLSCVVIKLKSEISGVTVQEVSFTNIAENGKCTNGTWTFGTTTNMLNYSQNLTLDTSAEDFVDASNGGFLVIPQQINGTQYINVTTSDKTYQAVIPDITWASGNKYTYTMTIKQDNIVFSEPTVVEWDEENATGSVIIK